MLSMINFKHSSSSYYSPLPIMPGIHFIKALIESKIDISNLKINVPWTIGLFSSKFVLSTGKDGRLKIEEGISENDVMEMIENETK